MAAYDAIVLGLGGMGSAAAAHLAKRGARVLGLERFVPGHTMGASHGRSRIFRVAYFEHPDYVPLLLRAHDLWRHLERETGRRLLVLTGGAMVGPRDGELVAGAERSATLHDLPCDLVDAAELHRRVPVFEPRDEWAVMEPQAGVLDPEGCVEAHLQVAREAGADLRFEEPAEEWTARAGGVEVRTGRGRHAADRLVVTAGPWAGRVLADLRLPLSVERNVVFWFRPPDLEAFGAERCPIFIWETDDGRFFYGLPSVYDQGFKVAKHHAGQTGDPETISRRVEPRDAVEVREFLRRSIPGADREPADAMVCLYTNTPDGHFIIDRHPEHERVTIACGFSGHGYKFCSAVGEILADLALDGRSRHDLTLFRLGRFF